MLDQNVAIPLYVQLKEAIQNRIVSGDLPKNSKLPSESELIRQYGVSRITVRKAMSELMEENYLIKKQGKGTFVRESKIERNINQVLSFSEVCRLSNKTPSSHVLSCEIRQATEEDAQRLKIAPEEKTVYIRRVRFADKNPVILEHLTLPIQYSGLMLEGLEHDSIYRILREKYHVDPVHAYRTIELDFATKEQAVFLGISPNYPLLLLFGVTMDAQGTPIHISKQYIIGDKFKLIL